MVARPARDVLEERKVRKIAGARHAPGDWIRRARMITASWDGKSTAQIAGELGCHPQTVRERLHRFNAHGLDGLGDRRGAGRRPRLTETERSRIVALVATTPPGRLTRPPMVPWKPSGTERRRAGRWIRSPRYYATRGWSSAVVRYAEFLWQRGFAGVGRGRGR
ncbi:helix-turn-helix domain-containing protein [Nocardia brevicatena]|uniref:helix-turn-helix domain-containing protein n=1 Tax=Nocardia brevicatena TaxID=37327 RepID=UPI001C3F417B|nr:helix-turn-helix domain-containing protein [Nocardia brevicatena]